MSKEHSGARNSMQAIHRYMSALERGDLAAAVAVLSEAEHDPTLETLALAVNDLYQSRDGIAVSKDDLHQARRFLNTLREEVKIGTNNEALAGGDDSLNDTQVKHGVIQERRSRPMQIETRSTPPDLRRPGKAAPPRAAHFRSISRLVQAVAAILIVGALIVAFVFVFSMRHIAPSQRTTTGSQNTALSIVAVLNRNGFIYGLDPERGATLWEFNTQAGNAIQIDSLTIQNQVVYAYIQEQGKLYALRASNGRLLWQTNLGIALGMSAQEAMTIDQGILFVNATDLNKGDILFAVGLKDGKILWHYHLGVSGGLAAANGIVYVCMDSDPFHPQLLALRSSDGALLWRYTAAPVAIAVANNVVYAYSAHVQTSSDFGGNKQYKTLLALNARSGTLIWSHSTIDDAISPLEIESGLIVLALTPSPNTYRFCGYHTADGTQVWCTQSVPPMAGDVTAFSVMDGAVYASYPSNFQNPFLKVEALDLQNGKVSWSEHINNIGGPGLLVTINGIVYTTVTGNSEIYALSSSNGQTLWRTNTGDVVAIAAGS